MSLVSGIVVFVVLWWLVFYAVLPWGVRRIDDNTEGHDAGAPANPRLWLKAGITTAITAILFAIAWWVISTDLISFHKG